MKVLENPRSYRPDPIRVLHCSQPVDGGTATVLQHLAEADLQKGRSVTIASPPGRLSRWAAEHGVPWIRLSLSREPRAADLWAVYKLRKLLRSVDLVFLHSSKAGAVGRLGMATLPRIQRPKCAFFPHAWSWYAGGHVGRLYRLFESLAAHWCDAIIAVSRGEELDGLACLFPSAARKLLLIENGIDVDAYTPSGEAAIRTSDPLIVCVGRLCKQKGQDDLIRSMSLLKDSTATLYLIGDGPDASDLRVLAQRLGVAHRVRFVGMTDPRPYFRAADIVAIPSRWEGLSLVLLEAMACGATVLATPMAAGSLSNDAAIITTAGAEPARFAEQITRLLADPESRRRHARRARTLVERRYSLQRATNEYHVLVDSLFQIDFRADPAGLWENTA